MTNAAKTGTVLVIIVVLIVIGLVWYMNDSEGGDLNTYTGPKGGAPSTATIDPYDRSDAAIRSDVVIVDKEMSGLDSDNAYIDQSLSSQ